jgi:DnaJ-class molecular chaperone
MSQGLGANFDRAQARYDAQTPDGDHNCVEECPDCSGSGYQPGGEVECLRCCGNGKLILHVWRRIHGSTEDGSTFVRCIHCGVTEEL